MNTTKLNDWLQIAASVGVIAGLLLVAYEVRISNRIGIEQGNAVALERWEIYQQMGTSPELANLLVRAHEGEELSRAEAVMLNNYVDQLLIAVGFDLQLIEHETLSNIAGSYVGILQMAMPKPYFERRWEVIGSFYSDRVVAAVDAALAAPEQRDILAYLDYIRGATNQLD